jgi:hypothetical protein
VIKQETDYLGFDMAKFMQLAASDTRWKDLPNNTTYSINKSILVTTTDVRKSNSAANFLAIASYVVNNDNVVQNDASAAGIADEVSPLFLRQGFVASSSEEPFDDYLVQGMGKSPLVMIYESQFIARAAANDGSITPDMVLVYPEPTIFSKHTFVSLTPDGARLGQFLATDPEIRSLATEFGFRTGDNAQFTAFVTAHNLRSGPHRRDLPPTYETLRRDHPPENQVPGPGLPRRPRPVPGPHQARPGGYR